MDESLDIMLWGLGRQDPERWLSPEHGDADGMLLLIQHFDERFKEHLDRYKYPNRFADADRSFSRHEASKSLLMLEKRFENSRFLFGNREALADMAIMPFVRQFSNVEPAWFEQQPWPGLQRWLALIIDSQRFARIMRPLKPWVSGTAGVPFPFID